MKFNSAKAIIIGLAATIGLSSGILMSEAKKAEEKLGEVEKVKIDPEAFKASGGLIDTSGPATIESRLALSGEVKLDADHSAKIASRFNGVVKEVLVSVGSQVKKGQVLATVESNESLSGFQILTPISGQVLERHISPGEAARDDKVVFVVADLSRVWVDLVGFSHDLTDLSLGQKVRIKDKLDGKITYISSELHGRSRSAIVRAEFDNTQKVLNPGSFVKAEVTTSVASAPNAIKRSALQTIEGRTSVFVPIDRRFETRNVIVGRMDEVYVEIVSGLKVGSPYASDGSIRLKSELLKAADGDDD